MRSASGRDRTGRSRSRGNVLEDIHACIAFTKLPTTTPRHQHQVDRRNERQWLRRHEFCKSLQGDRGVFATLKIWRSALAGMVSPAVAGFPGRCLQPRRRLIQRTLDNKCYEPFIIYEH